MPKTITIDVRMVQSSGIGTYIRNIIPYLLQSEYKLDLIGKQDELEELGWTSYQKVRVIPSTESIYSIKEQTLLPLRISKHTDLLWVPHFNIPVSYRGKMLVTVHDVFHLAMPQLLEGRLKKSYSRYLYKSVGRKANKIITVSDFSKKELHGFLGEDKSVSTIYNGVSPDWFDPHFDEVKEDIPYIVYVGNVKPHKNLKVLLDAYSRIMDQIPHNLVIVGKKEGFISGDQSIFNQADGIKKRVKFTGYVSDALLKSYIHHADVLVFPSLYEGFGLPPLEAMACGTPTIVSTAASIPEVCELASLYFDPHDSAELGLRLVGLLQDQSMQQDLINKGSAHVRKFTWKKSAEQHLRLIEEMVGS